MNTTQTKIYGLKHEKKYNDNRDNEDWIDNGHEHLHDKIKEEFSDKNKIVLQKVIDILKNQKSFNNILEIGVYRSSLVNNIESSSTKFILNRKPQDTKYLGVDANKICIDSIINKQNNIHGLCCLSQDHERVRKYMEQIQMETIDLLFIDGWHSINQLYLDFHYAKFLSKNGIVFFHDTNYHPGPKVLLECIDQKIFDIFKFYENEEDWGVAYAQKII